MEQTLPGPPAIFVSGLPEDIDDKLKPLLSEAGIDDIPVIFCTASMMRGTLIQALEDVFTDDPLPPDMLPPVMVFSGITMDQVQSILSGYSRTGLQRPIFATTTDHNLLFTVKELIMHLLEERRQHSSS
ncbi:MAG: DUF3783 domain-containing protein [Spirochaetota bacterium]